MVSSGVIGQSSVNTIIYFDYTSGYHVTLPTGLNTSLDTTYSTTRPGSFSFGLDWNGDADDVYSFSIPTSLTITPVGTAGTLPFSFCNIPPGGQVTFTNTSIHQCNYTGSWTTQFFGIFSVNYNNGQSGAPTGFSSNTVSVEFTFSIVVGDPQFVGFRGQSYQVHGIDGGVYNLISERNSQVNSRFVFLNEGKCPILNGVKQANCWSHPGSYLGEISYQQIADGKRHAALVTSGTAKKGFAGVQMDGKALTIGESISFGIFSLSFNSSHLVTVSTENFDFELSNSDMFINQAVTPTTPLSQLTSHGLLGQTHTLKIYKSMVKYIVGDVDDYVIADNNIWGSDCVYNQFNPTMTS